MTPPSFCKVGLQQMRDLHSLFSGDLFQNQSLESNNILKQLKKLVPISACRMYMENHECACGVYIISCILAVLSA